MRSLLAGVGRARALSQVPVEGGAADAERRGDLVGVLPGVERGPGGGELVGVELAGRPGGLPLAWATSRA